MEADDSRRALVWSPYARRGLLVVLICGLIALLIRGGIVWVRDNVFPPPDPIELRHRIEAAGAWPLMMRIADKRLAEDERGVGLGLRDKALSAAGMNMIT